MTCPTVRVFHGKAGLRIEEWRRLRRIALRLLRAEMPPSEVAADLGVSSWTVSQWKHRFMPESRRSPLHGPCKEWGCAFAVETRHGYCQKHTQRRVWRKAKARQPKRAAPCRNAPACERRMNGKGARGLCARCYLREWRAQRHARAAHEAAEVGL